MNVRIFLWIALLALSGLVPESMAAQAWKLVQERTFPLPTEVSRPRSMARLSDGAIALLDVRAPYVHILNSAGTLVKSFLGAGEGPGSARMPLTISAAGANLWAWDPGNGRMTLFNQEGKVLREVPLRVEGNVLAMGPNRFLVIPMTGFGAGMDSVRTLRLALIDSTGRTTGTLFTFRDIVRSLVIPAASGARVGRQPFHPNAMTLTSPGGNGIAVVFPAVIDRPVGTAFRIVRFSPSGQQVFDRWIQVRGERIGALQVDAAVRMLSSGPDSLDPSVPRRMRAALQVPKYIPAASVGFVGRNGETWLREFSIGREERDWFVVSGVGSVVGRVALPKGEHILGLLGEQILTTREGANGEPQLSLYNVVRNK